MSPAEINHTRSVRQSPLTDLLIVIIPLLLVVGGLAGAGAIILLGGHADQAQPRIAEFYPPGSTGPVAANDTPATRKLLGNPPGNPCLPSRLPASYDILHQAKAQDRQAWMLVHEGDRTAIIKALIRDAEHHGGYAVAIPTPFGRPSQTAILAPRSWYQQRLDPLELYAQKPDVTVDSVNAGYVGFATAALTTPESTSSLDYQASQCPELLPAAVIVKEKPVGELSDSRTAIGAWILIGLAVLFTAWCLHTLQPGRFDQYEPHKTPGERYRVPQPQKDVP